MNSTYLLLGSNLGNPEKQLRDAARTIEKKIGRIIRRSSVYRTSAWGKSDQPDFLNQVVKAESTLTAPEMMKAILHIEKNMGRVRTEKNAPRIIDIDILFFNKEIIEEPGLSIPHPQIQNRRFVLVPLNELSPNLLHPVSGKTIHQLLRICPDKLAVKKN
jgi:2-amino-4-hydroxy-6-hydroxymethyldihydropteridine diphosphokinase